MLAGRVGRPQSDLGEGDLHPLDRLLIERRRHIAGDDDCPDVLVRGKVQAAERIEFPSLAAGVRLGWRAVRLESWHREATAESFRASTEHPSACGCRRYVSSLVSQTSTLWHPARGKIFEVAVERRIEAADLAETWESL